MNTEGGGQNLKGRNYALIFAYLVAHLLLSYLVLLQTKLPEEFDLKTLSTFFGGASLASVIVIVVVEAIGRDTKARLVELRWNNPWPGCQAFTVHMHEDPRINTLRLGQRLGKLPSHARDQNALWYKLLKQNSTSEEVMHAHGRSLLFRDLCWVSLCLLLLVFLASFRAPAALPPTLLLLLILTTEFWLIRAVAKRASRDLVKTVLAVESTRDIAI